MKKSIKNIHNIGKKGLKKLLYKTESEFKTPGSSIKPRKKERKKKIRNLSQNSENMITGRTLITGLFFLDTDLAFRMDRVAPLPLFDMADWPVVFSVDITIAAGS